MIPCDKTIVIPWKMSMDHCTMLKYHVNTMEKFPTTIEPYQKTMVLV